MHSSTGSTFIEILISLLLISILLFGVDAMQILSLRLTKIHYYYAVAEQQMNNMIQRLSVDHTPDIATWNKQNQMVLPEGRGEINNKLKLVWGNMNAEKCESNKMDYAGCLQIPLS